MYVKFLFFTFHIRCFNLLPPLARPPQKVLNMAGLSAEIAHLASNESEKIFVGS